MRRRLPSWTVFAAAIAGLLTLAVPALAQVTGPDVSSFQHPYGYSINWNQVRGDGQAFAFIKATEGTGYTNPYYSRDVTAAAAAGLAHGAYHFARPAWPTSTAVAQARYFVRVAGAQHTAGYLPPTLDLEVTGGLSPSQLISWTQTWVSTVQSLTGRRPIIYSYPYFWQHQMANTHAFTSYPLWIASYSSHVAMVGGWSTYTFWQFTDAANLRGISGSVDQSVYNGTLAQLHSLALMAGGAPTPAPTPTGPPPFAATVRPGDQNVTVSWPAQAGATGYQVTSATGGSWSAAATATSVQIDGLTNGTAYRFTVTATMPDGSTKSTPLSPSVIPVIPTAMRIQVAPTTVGTGQSTRIVATLQRDDRGPVLSGTHVTVYGRWAGSGGVRPIASAVTDAYARISVVTRVGQNALFQVSATGPYGHPTSGWAAVNVVPLIAVAAGGSGHVVVLHGWVVPGRAGNTVIVQSFIHGAWRGVGTARLAANSGYSARIVYRYSGVYPIRVVAPATAYHTTAASRTVVERVH